MPRNERVIVVFVASPSDLDPERNRLEEVIRELNVTWSRSLGARLDLVRWETHGFPGIGGDAQDVLNHELPGDYDIFVGLMWGRYGTPTGRAGSGTEEEYTRALERFRSRPGSVKIMFYFKDAPLVPSRIDPDQLAKVLRFRESLGAEGSLYWSFTSLGEFERLIRLHLARQIQESFNQEGRSAMPAAVAPNQQDSASHDDLGLLDLLDLVEGHFADLNEIIVRIGVETSTLGTRMTERTSEINAAQEQTRGEIDRRDARAFIEKAAVDMNHYVVRVRAELPLFREALSKGVDATARTALMTVEMNSADRTQVRSARTSLTELVAAIEGAYDSIESFRGTVFRLPRMTALLNRAKRDTTEVLDEILQSMDEGRRVITEAVKALDSLLGQDGADV
jgi:hypothetical protein